MSRYKTAYQFVVAPSGAGKSYFADKYGQGFAVDGDTLREVSKAYKVIHDRYGARWYDRPDFHDKREGGPSISDEKNSLLAEAYEKELEANKHLTILTAEMHSVQEVVANHPELKVAVVVPPPEVVLERQHAKPTTKLQPRWSLEKIKGNCAWYASEAKRLKWPLYPDFQSIGTDRVTEPFHP